MSWRLLLVVLALWAAGPAAAQSVRTDHVEVELHSARAAIAPGERFSVVLRQTIREHWHTYWRNPGAAGEPTEIAWRLPPGFTASEIAWPTPAPIAFESLVNYGYSGEVLLPVEIAAPARLRPGDEAALRADATWVVCSDICVFEQGTLTLTLPVAAAGRDDPVWAPRIAAARAALPLAYAAGGPVTARVTAGDPARVSIAVAGATAREAHFFPYSRDAIDPSAPQSPRAGPMGVSFDLPKGVDATLGRERLDGVVAFQDASGRQRAYEVRAEPGPPLPGAGGERAAAAAGGGIGLVAALGLAFLGGLVLNVMPCVLPVLAIKALSFAGGAQAGSARRRALFYLAGVLATFVALAALLIALRGAGEALGWGFQMQTPLVNAGLALLFFAIGLNLSGAFSIGGAENLGAGLAARGGDAGAFFTGALAVAAATPCTAPFMAGAMGAALTQSPPATLAIFAVLGFGFALPLTALALLPGLRRLIPKPGAWMERVKTALAFPMFATAAWLAWVLTEQAGASGVLALMSLAVALAFALTAMRWGRAWAALGAVVLAATAALAFDPLRGGERAAALASQPWSTQAVSALRAEGKPAFVNFTAAWCVTCKVNEAAALQNPRVARAFADAGVAYFKADWTNRDAAIAQALAEHGRAGVPLYLYYPRGGGEPIVLPQILSESVILEAVKGG